MKRDEAMQNIDDLHTAIVDQDVSVYTRRIT